MWSASSWAPYFCTCADCWSSSCSGAKLLIHFDSLRVVWIVKCTLTIAEFIVYSLGPLWIAFRQNFIVSLLFPCSLNVTPGKTVSIFVPVTLQVQKDAFLKALFCYKPLSHLLNNIGVDNRVLAAQAAIVFCFLQLWTWALWWLRWQTSQRWLSLHTAVRLPPDSADGLFGSDRRLSLAGSLRRPPVLEWFPPDRWLRDSPGACFVGNRAQPEAEADRAAAHVWAGSVPASTSPHLSDEDEPMDF